MLDQFERARNSWLADRLAELTEAERDTLRQAAEILQQIARG